MALLLLIFALVNSFAAMVTTILIEIPIDVIDLIRIATLPIETLAFIVLLVGYVTFEHKLRTLQIPNNIQINVKHIALIIVPFILAALLVCTFTPISYSVWKFEVNLNETSKAVIYSFTTTLYVKYLLNGIIRIVMIAATVYIAEAWQSAQGRIDYDLYHNFIPIDINNYQNTGEVVSAVQGIFQSWFVLQWITYFVGISVQCRFIILYIENDLEYYYLILACGSLLHSIFEFVIPYGCGIVMNKYYDRYIKQLKQRLFRNLDVANVQYEINHRKRQKEVISWIIKYKEYEFKPSIYGLSIPLSNVGHQLTILLTLLAPILSLIKI